MVRTFKKHGFCQEFLNSIFDSISLCTIFKYYIVRMLNPLPESAGVLKSLTHVKDSYPPKMRYLLASLSAYMPA